MKTVYFIIGTFSITFLSLSACLATSVNKSAKAGVACESVAQEVIASRVEGESPNGGPLPDGGFLGVLVNPLQRTIRGVIIASPHLTKQFAKQAKLTAQGQCEHDGLTYEVNRFEVRPDAESGT